MSSFREFVAFVFVRAHQLNECIMKSIVCAWIVVANGTLHGAIAQASRYDFVQVADSGSSLPDGGIFGAFGQEPSISAGSVAFEGIYSTLPGLRFGVFTGSGGPVTRVAGSGDAAPIGYFAQVGRIVNDGNRVVAWGNYGPLNGSGEIFKYDHSGRTTIVKTGDLGPLMPFDDVYAAVPAMDGESVVFADIGQGVFVSQNGVTRTIVKGGDNAPIGNFYSFGRAPDISGNLIAFSALSSDSVSGDYASGVYRSDGTSLTRIASGGAGAADDTFTFTDLRDVRPVISGLNVAFKTTRNFVGEAIYLGNGGPIETIVKSGDSGPIGEIQKFGNVAISGERIAFQAYGAGDQSAILVSRVGETETVIKMGDSLFGSTVSYLRFGRFGLDHQGTGNLAFHYRLQSGGSGIAMAISVPEMPAGGSFWVAIVSGWMAALRRRQQAGGMSMKARTWRRRGHAIPVRLRPATPAA
jgi:hypothetical protein